MLTVEQISELLPNEIRQKFWANTELSLCAVNVSNRLINWFENSTMPFFRFYTDHTAKHSLEVFQTAIDFIPNEAYHAITGEDISILLLSCYCHDSGLHLTEDQFSKLIHSNKSNSEFDVHSWKELWKIFLEEARRYNAEKLVNIFGDENPVELPPSNPMDFTDRHRLLIGEFLRKNHPRFSHDLVNGLDAELGLKDMFDGLSSEQKDIVGLVSRSHGMALRDTFKYVNTHFDLRDYNRIHIVFLMCLLRISDYAQIQAARAPSIKKNIHSITSPISKQEWRVHESVKNITRTHDDPESIYISSNPKNVSDYLRIKYWLDDWQNEIDTSWAITGEIYGRQSQTKLNKLGFSIRRVRASIYEEQKDYPYIAKEIRFRVAEAEMLSLLIAPLYGDHPGYGVRELYQNAMDATKEAIAIDARHLAETNPRVVVSLHIDGNSSCFAICDNGLGMDVDVIENYFLNAGASFRSSSTWKSQYEDEQGKSFVSRSGRFGVGALAAFLIGDAIKVTTKHFTENNSNGFEFSTNINSKAIEILRKKTSFGTLIEIPTDKNNALLLESFLKDFEKYFSKQGSIVTEVKIFENGKLTYSHILEDESKKPILEVSTKNFEAVKIFEASKRREIPDSVNGIRIAEYKKDSISRYDGAHILDLFYPLATPLNAPSDPNTFGYRGQIKGLYCEIVDKNGHADLNLARTTFNTNDEELTSITTEFAFKEFSKALKKINNQLPDSLSNFKILNPVYTFGYKSFAFSKKKIIPYDRKIMEIEGVEKLVYTESSSELESLTDRHEDCFFILGDIPNSATSLTEFLRHLRTINENYNMKTPTVAILKSEVAFNSTTLSNTSQWLKNMVRSAPTLEIDTEQYSILTFGSVNDKILEKATSISTGIKEGHKRSIVYQESKKWSHESPYRGYYNKEGSFSNLWKKTSKKRKA